jgi:hypothetical protein
MPEGEQARWQRVLCTIEHRHAAQRTHVSLPRAGKIT